MGKGCVRERTRGAGACWRDGLVVVLIAPAAAEGIAVCGSGQTCGAHVRGAVTATAWRRNWRCSGRAAPTKRSERRVKTSNHRQLCCPYSSSSSSSYSPFSSVVADKVLSRGGHKHQSARSGLRLDDKRYAAPPLRRRAEGRGTRHRCRCRCSHHRGAIAVDGVVIVCWNASPTAALRHGEGRGASTTTDTTSGRGGGGGAMATDAAARAKVVPLLVKRQRRPRCDECAVGAVKRRAVGERTVMPSEGERRRQQRRGRGGGRPSAGSGTTYRAARWGPNSGIDAAEPKHVIVIILTNAVATAGRPKSAEVVLSCPKTKVESSD